MNLSSLVREVEKYIQQRLPQYIEELRALCAIDSDSYNKAGLDEMAFVLAERMQLADEEQPAFDRDAGRLGKDRTEVFDMFEDQVAGDQVCGLYAAGPGLGNIRNAK